MAAAEKGRPESAFCNLAAEQRTIVAYSGKLWERTAKIIPSSDRSERVRRHFLRHTGFVERLVPATLSPHPGLDVHVIRFPQLPLWATIYRCSAAEMRLSPRATAARHSVAERKRANGSFTFRVPICIFGFLGHSLSRGFNRAKKENKYEHTYRRP
jgi:hypothetical protein